MTPDQEHHWANEGHVGFAHGGEPKQSEQGEREETLNRAAFDAFAEKEANRLFSGRVYSHQAPFYMAIWRAAIEWDRARQASPPAAAPELSDADITAVLLRLHPNIPVCDGDLRAARAVIAADRTALMAKDRA